MNAIRKPFTTFTNFYNFPRGTICVVRWVYINDTGPAEPVALQIIGDCRAWFGCFSIL